MLISEKKKKFTNKTQILLTLYQNIHTFRNYFIKKIFIELKYQSIFNSNKN